jgi:hypothetical protein
MFLFNEFGIYVFWLAKQRRDPGAGQIYNRNRRQKECVN